jgi:hypothetical protein
VSGAALADQASAELSSTKTIHAQWKPLRFGLSGSADAGTCSGVGRVKEYRGNLDWAQRRILSNSSVTAGTSPSIYATV